MFTQRFGPYIRHLKAVRIQFIIGLLCGMVAAAASGAGLPLIIKYLVPLVTRDPAPSGAQLYTILATVPLVFALRAAGTFFNAYYMAYAGMHVLERLRLMVFGKIQFLPLSFFSKNNNGDLMSRVSGDTAILQSAIISVVNSLIKEPATLISAIGFLIYLSITQNDAIFMLIALATVPACVFPIRMIGKRILKKAAQVQTQAGELNNILNENLSAVREVRAYNLEEREIDRFSTACKAFFKYTLKTVKYDKLLTPMIEFISALAIVFALYVAVTKNISPEIIASILTALYMCYEPVKKLGAVSNIIRKAEASLNRLEYILHSKDDVPEAEQPQMMPKIRGHIRFESVSFSYGEEVVLKSINTEIPAGEVQIGRASCRERVFAKV